MSVGLCLCLPSGRASSNDLYIVQQLINDSVSLLVYSGDDYGVGEEGDGGGRGSGKRRSRGDYSRHQGAWMFFIHSSSFVYRREWFDNRAFFSPFKTTF